MVLQSQRSTLFCSRKSHNSLHRHNRTNQVQIHYECYTDKHKLDNV
jgi:hypothetical protein